MSDSQIIGFLGAGQLARMGAQAAIKHGHKVHIFSDRGDNEPACELASQVFTGSFEDTEKLIEFFNSCTVVTLENEFMNAELLTKLEGKTKTPMFPSATTFKYIENKLDEKRVFQKAGIPVVPFALIKTEDDIEKFTAEHNFPVVIKSSKGGYDGYGNAFAKDINQAKEALAELSQNGRFEVIIEKSIKLKQEYAIQVARSKSECITYPVCETVHKNHICTEVLAPSNLPEILEETIKNYALKAMICIDSIGLFAFEFFLDEDNKLYLNESAPRTHNSGHYTIEACETSQFENHIRAITNTKLGPTNLKVPAAVMVNLLGTRNGTPAFVFPDYNDEPNVHIHNYAKIESRLGRKMGHLTITGENLEEIRKLALKIQNSASI
jgi:5-(carboxyamino)imidazole ribonucleotide synthase